MQLLRRLFSPFQNYFYFNAKERMGIMAFIVLTTLCLLSPFYLPFFVSSQSIEVIPIPTITEDKTTESDTSDSKKRLFRFNPNTATEEMFRQLGLKENTIVSILKYREKGGKFKSAQDFAKIYTLPPAQFQELFPYIDVFDTTTENNVLKDFIYFNFNPNTVNPDSLVLMGFKVAYTKKLQAYRIKGGHFYYKEDLLKIYGADTSLIVQVMPYVQLPSHQSTNAINTNPINTNPMLPDIAPSKTNFTMIEINAASTEEWKRLPSIGEGYSKKIVRHRENLGGFYKLEQLIEILPDSVFQKIKPQLNLNHSSIKKLKVNKLSLQELARHPYIKYSKAKLIFNTRLHHGSFKNSTELLKLPTFDTDIIEKLKPYLDFEE